MSEITVEFASANDLPGLSVLATQAFVGAWGPVVGDFFARAYAERQLTPAALGADIYAHPEQYLIARDAAGALLGYARIDPQAQAPAAVVEQIGRPVLLQRLYLAQAAWGSGAGSVLHARARELALQNGDGVWLVTDPRNARAWAFYLKLGYRDCCAYPYEYAAGRCNEQCRALVAAA